VTDTKSSELPIESEGRRDLRLDAFRGLALWFTFLDHVPNNALAWLTIRNYGFSDASEVFVFISGYTCMIAYGGALREQGWPTTIARAMRRGWEIYAAFLLLLLAYFALVWLVGGGSNYRDETNTGSFFQDPGATLAHAMVMQYAPANTDILPTFVLLHLAFPPLLWLLMCNAGLALTRENLGYTYGSADPANGGMDCSGFIYYILKQNGFPDVPRDSSQQYVWVRKAGNFYAVLSRKEDSFEFDDLKPGDLLFWRGTYNIDRDPPITHTMIYLGREKRTNKRVMVGSSDGRTYDGKQRWGVSVFDFKMPPPPNSGDAKISPVFVGYGRIPGLVEE